ncbi:uncharacterized protein SCHCODRAFT_02672077 [Schizophyllum commune H4-8]|nr:uncharacterized protein SCHCODRAFT_02672077 [Schizophyllum commune H4-8]KAI5886866.1 hypothetical protein SCHCODRAFT_02672077 [Schizophyllum commune H4-8]
MNYPARSPGFIPRLPQSRIVACLSARGSSSSSIYCASGPGDEGGHKVGACAAPRSGRTDVPVEALLSTTRTSRPPNPPGQHALKPHLPLAEVEAPFTSHRRPSSHVRDLFAAICDPDLRSTSIFDVHGAEAHYDAVAAADHRHPDDV